MGSRDRQDLLTEALDHLVAAMVRARKAAHEDSQLAIRAAIDRIEADLLVEVSGSHD